MFVRNLIPGQKVTFSDNSTYVNRPIYLYYKYLVTDLTPGDLRRDSKAIATGGCVLVDSDGLHIVVSGYTSVCEVFDNNNNLIYG